MKEFKPEGQLIRTPENRTALASPSALPMRFRSTSCWKGAPWCATGRTI